MAKYCNFNIFFLCSFNFISAFSFFVITFTSSFSLGFLIVLLSAGGIDWWESLLHWKNTSNRFSMGPSTRIKRGFFPDRFMLSKNLRTSPRRETLERIINEYKHTFICAYSSLWIPAPVASTILFTLHEGRFFNQRCSS